jgi:hypothetical protein
VLEFLNFSQLNRVKKKFIKKMVWIMHKFIDVFAISCKNVKSEIFLKEFFYHNFPFFDLFFGGGRNTQNLKPTCFVPTF